MTVSEAVVYGTQSLSDCGIEEAKNDAWLLFEFVTGISRTHFFLYPDKELDESIVIKYQNLLKKRAEHYPLQYITGTQQFMGYDFYVDESVLIPRPETELLVLETEKIISDRANKYINADILDMCTGSGCIAVSLKLRNSGCRLTAVDISDSALAVAKKNADFFNADISFYKSDLFSDIACHKYDIIVSNPPYIETKELDFLMSEVKDYEPLIGLDGREDGLYFYRKIINNSVNFLNPNGKILFEIGCKQADSVKLILREAGFKNIKVIKDLSGLDRIVIGGI